jgi:pimeloyl-ACP methyl ester carboxylesterase
MRFAFGISLAAAVVTALPVSILAAPVPSAIYTDPVHDAKYPAAMVVLHIPTHGLAINGLAYVPVGRGPHPVLVICHGLPGNEKNLDLAQAVRRAGWVAVTFNYRGSWGSPGSYSLLGNLDDAAAVLTYLRDPHNAGALREDPKRIAIAGHSMGGWVAATTAARDSGVIGTALISPLDPASPMTHEDAIAFMADNLESLAGATAESLAAERDTHINEMALSGAVEGLKGRPLLALSVDDGPLFRTDALVEAIQASGGGHVTAAHVATDHAWSDRRIELESRVVRWLQTLH